MPFARIEKASSSGMSSRIRRAARKADLRATKTRWRQGTPDNLGGWKIVDSDMSLVVYGARYELTDLEALACIDEYCGRA